MARNRLKNLTARAQENAKWQMINIKYMKKIRH